VEEGARECARHERWYSLVPAVFGMPYPEDAVSVQEILARAVAMVMRREMAPEQGRAIAALCREMRHNLRGYEQEMKRVSGLSFLVSREERGSPQLGLHR
jgi:hypothetical protein